MASTEFETLVRWVDRRASIRTYANATVTWSLPAGFMDPLVGELQRLGVRVPSAMRTRQTAIDLGGGHYIAVRPFPQSMWVAVVADRLPASMRLQIAADQMRLYAGWGSIADKDGVTTALIMDHPTGEPSDRYQVITMLGDLADLVQSEDDDALLDAGDYPSRDEGWIATFGGAGSITVHKGQPRWGAEGPHEIVFPFTIAREGAGALTAGADDALVAPAVAQLSPPPRARPKVVTWIAVGALCNLAFAAWVGVLTYSAIRRR